MLEKILYKIAKLIYPKRNFKVVKVGGHFIIRLYDVIRCNTYLLEGKYSYDEVMKLTDSIQGDILFGFCNEIGPVALMEKYYPRDLHQSGYFRYNVMEYGKPYDEDEYYFEAYTDEEAKYIENYTVYGACELEEVAKLVPISKINYFLDSRWEAKNAYKPKVFDMDCKLKGVYSYKEAKILSTGTLKEKNGYSGEDHPIVFATIENGQHVGIINMWPSDIEMVRGFRDVWEYGSEEPKTQKISFLTKREAAKIKDYTLFVYNYCCSGIGRDKYQIEKYDRTLDKRFKFQLPDGTDYRLVEHNELFK